MDEIDSICENQQNALEKIKEKLKTLSAKNECKQAQNIKSSGIVNEGVSKDLNQSEQSVSTKVKNVSFCSKSFQLKISMCSFILL